MKEFRKSVNICGSYEQEFSVLFLKHSVVVRALDSKLKKSRGSIPGRSFFA